MVHSVSFAPDSWPGIAPRAPGYGSSPTSHSMTAESGSLLTASSYDRHGDCRGGDGHHHSDCVGDHHRFQKVAGSGPRGHGQPRDLHP